MHPNYQRRIFSSIYFSNASIIRHRKIGLQEDDYKTRGKWDVILRNRWNRWLSSISWLCAITMRTTDMRYASAILLKIFPAAGSASESEKHLHCTVELGWWHTFLSTSNLSCEIIKWPSSLDSGPAARLYACIHIPAKASYLIMTWGIIPRMSRIFNIDLFLSTD